MKIRSIIILLVMSLSVNVQGAEEINLEDEAELCNFVFPSSEMVLEVFSDIVKEKAENLASASYDGFIIKGGGGLKLSSSEDKTKATIDAALHSANHRFNIGFSGKLDDDKQSSFSDKDGLSSDASVKVKWRYYPNDADDRIREINNLVVSHYLSNDGVYNQVINSCKNDFKTLKLKSDVSSNDVKKVREKHKERLDKLNTDLDSYIKSRKLPVFPVYTSWDFTLESGRSDFKYLDPASVVVGESLDFTKDNKKDLKLGVGFSIYNTENSYIHEFGISYSKQYGFPTGVKREFCRQATENDELSECFTAIAEVPEERVSKNIFYNYVKIFDNSLLKAIETKLNYDTEKSRWNVSIPLYFWMSSKSEPIAGLRIDWLQDPSDNEESVQTTLFYSVPLKFE